MLTLRRYAHSNFGKHATRLAGSSSDVLQSSVSSMVDTYKVRIYYRPTFITQSHLTHQTKQTIYLTAGVSKYLAYTLL